MNTTNETNVSLVFYYNLMSSPFLAGYARNSSLALEQEASSRHLSITSQVVITTFYVFGVVGNIAALCDSQPRNPKHVLMLRCLACNDLTAVSGMLTLMNLQLYKPALSHSRVFCVLRVLWRLFGLGSGCVAIVMAVERWCALTRPFFYQKHVTTAVIRRSIFSLWSVALLLVCLPFFGFGMYFEPHTATCVRYRVADQPKDIAYAYLFLIFGSLLCLGIVWCNMAVARALCHSPEGHAASTTDPVNVPRRTSRNRTLSPNACTKEELAFARLMAVLCIVFVIGWMPQMISIVIAQVAPESSSSRTFFRVADVLMLLHFCLDPYLYVLQRWPCFRALCSGNFSKTQASIQKPPPPASKEPTNELIISVRNLKF